MNPRLLFGAALCFGLVAPPQLLRAQEDVAALEKEYQTAVASFQAKLAELRNAGKSREEIAAFGQANNPAKDFVARFQAGAKAHAGKEAAIPYLLWLGQNAARAVAMSNAGGAPGAAPSIADDAWVTLLRDHAASDQIGRAVQTVGRMGRTLGGEKVRSMLTNVIEKNPSEAIVVEARFARASTVLGDEEASDDARAMAKADFQAVMASKAVPALAQRAEGQLFVLQNLQIGMTAPDIEANDLDGVAFKLSDYRGKVVVLDFWGDW
ncbi:MAG: redoxin domain-containing protein [Planctomycetes bacterium]|nr:redoxin domain-containing protein [Planctomycetota bacterium]